MFKRCLSFSFFPLLVALVLLLEQYHSFLFFPESSSNKFIISRNTVRPIFVCGSCIVFENGINDLSSYLGVVVQWYSQRTSVLEVAGLISASKRGSRGAARAAKTLRWRV